MQNENKRKMNENGSPGPETQALGTNGDHRQGKRGGNAQWDADLFEAD